MRSAQAAWLAAFSVAVVVGPFLYVRPFDDVGERFIGHGDQAMMAMAARNLAEGRGAVVDTIWLLHGGGLPGNEVTHPDEYWSLYVAAIVAPFFYVLGATHQVVVFVAWLHALGIACLAAYWARRFTDNRLAAFTVAMVLLFDPAMSRTLNGLFDIYLTLYVFASGTCLILAVERDSRRLFLLAGVLAGVAAAIKLTGLLIIGCAVAWFVLPRSRWSRFARGSPYAIGVLVGLAPLVAFNLVHFGSLLQPGIPLVRVALIASFIANDYNMAFYHPGPEFSDAELRAAAVPWALMHLRQWAVAIPAGKVVPWVILLPLFGYALTLVAGKGRPRPGWSQPEGLFATGTALLVAGSAVLALGVRAEPRYLNFLIPPFAVLGVVGLARTFPVLLVGVMLWVGSRAYLNADYFTPSRLPSEYALVSELLPEDAIVLSSNPWELAFHTRRRSVVLPYSGDVELLRSIANRYGAEYIVIVRKGARHRGYDDLENGIFEPWVERVYFSDKLVIGRLRQEQS